MALVDPRVGFFSHETQKITNWLPRWHAGRRLRTSNWASVVNSLAGETIDDLRIQQDRAFRNLYLQTVHLDELDIIRRAKLRADVDTLPQTIQVNLLRNGNFALRSRPDRVGDFWSNSGTVDVADGLFGTRSARLLPDANSISRLSQTVSELDAWGVAESRTFSTWYRIPTWSGGTVPSDSHGIVVEVTYHDNTTQLFRTAFEVHTSGQWRRATLVATATKTVASWDMRLETRRSATFEITAPVDLDGAQVQQGTMITGWEPNFADRPSWFTATQPVAVQVDTDVDVFLTTSLRDFHYEAVPTRVSLLATRSVVSIANRGGGITTLTDYDRNQWLASWEVDVTQNKILLKGIEPQDEYASTDISFFVGTDTGPKYQEGVSGQTYRSAIAFGHWVWVIHEMIGLDGNAQVVLSICSPRLPYPDPTHIESRYTLPLPLLAGVDYHSIEFRVEDPQHIYVSSATEEFVLRLFYDYGMIDTQTFELFLREPYTKLAVVK